MPETKSPKTECLTIMGVGLTAAALVIASLSLLFTNTPPEAQDSLFRSATSLLKSVAFLFLYSSIVSVGSFALCYVYDLSLGRLGKAEQISATALALSIICSFILLVWGIIQLVTVLQILWS